MTKDSTMEQSEFLQQILEQLDIHIKKKKKNLNTDLASFTKINSKWILGLSVKCRAIKV